MIPRPRLILLSALTVVPLLGVAGSWPSLEAGALMLLVVAAVAAGIDAAQGRKKLLAVKALLPARVRWVQGRPALLEIGFETPAALPLVLRVAPALPPEIASEREEIEITLPNRAGRHFFTFPCRPVRRGLFHIAGCHYETASPFGLWDVRGRLLQPVEVRVYPNMDSERRQVAALFLRTRHSGALATRQVGQGRDFEKLRDYVPGDAYGTIHWKATARRGHPITKTFQVEKTQEVYVLLDASRLSARLQVAGDATQGTHLDRAIAAALVLGLAAEKQGDLFGLVTFGERVLGFVRARNGKEHYGACREALYRLEAQPVSPDFEEVASFVRLRLRRRALLIFLTDLDDPVLMESFQRAAGLIADKHLVLVHMLRPADLRPLFTNPHAAQVDDIYRDLAQHLAWHELRELTGRLRQQGVGLQLGAREQFSAEAVSSYLRVKQRQLL